MATFPHVDSKRTEHVVTSTIYSPAGDVTNASCTMSHEGKFVSLIDPQDGLGIILRTYAPGAGTLNVVRLTRDDMALIRSFLFHAETGF